MVTSGSIKVVDFNFDTNRKHVCIFQLVINNNFDLILHCFGNMVAQRLKIANSYLPHCHLTLLLGLLICVPNLTIHFSEVKVKFKVKTVLLKIFHL